MSNRSSCYHAEKLSEYLLGILSENECIEIERHLETCDSCEAIVESLDVNSDSLISSLAEPHDDQAESEPELANALNEILRQAEKTQAGDSNIRRIGDYEIVSTIGRGGMGTVFLARHVTLDKHVAIKVLPHRHADDKEAIARFTREMTIVGKLSHPSMVTALDAGKADGIHYLAMEVIDGLDLTRVMATVSTLNTADACEIIRQAALGLDHAHQLGVVHRDIKPSNLMLDRNGSIKILDLGLATLGGLHGTVDRLTTVGQLMGTLDYMPPEQCEAHSSADILSDIYSLAATLYHLITGTSPYESEELDSPLKKLKAIVAGPPPSLAARDPSLPRELVEIVDRCLSHDPGDRLPNTKTFADALGPFASENNLAELFDACQSSESDGIAPSSQDVDNEFSAAARELREYLKNKNDTRILAAGKWRLFLVAVPLLILAIVATGVSIWINSKLDFGHLVVESKIDGAQVRITQIEYIRNETEDVRTTEVGTFTIDKKNPLKTRLESGTYEIELLNNKVNYSVSNRMVRLRRGGAEIARIHQTPEGMSPYSYIKNRDKSDVVEALDIRGAPSGCIEWARSIATQMQDAKSPISIDITEKNSSIVLSGESEQVAKVKEKIRYSLAAFSGSGFELDDEVVYWYVDRIDNAVLVITRNYLADAKSTFALHKFSLNSRYDMGHQQVQLILETDLAETGLQFGVAPAGLIRAGREYMIWSDAFENKRQGSFGATNQPTVFKRVDVNTLELKPNFDIGKVVGIRDLQIPLDLAVSASDPRYLYFLHSHTLYQIDCSTESKGVKSFQIENKDQRELFFYPECVALSPDNDQLVLANSRVCRHYSLDEETFTLEPTREFFEGDNVSFHHFEIADAEWIGQFLVLPFCRLHNFAENLHLSPVTADYSGSSVCAMHPERDLLAIRRASSSHRQLILRSASTGREIAKWDLELTNFYQNYLGKGLRWINNYQLAVFTRTRMRIVDVTDIIQQQPGHLILSSADSSIKVWLGDQIDDALEIPTIDGEPAKATILVGPENARIQNDRFVWRPESRDVGIHRIKIEIGNDQQSSRMDLTVDVRRPFLLLSERTTEWSVSPNGQTVVLEKLDNAQGRRSLQFHDMQTNTVIEEMEFLRDESRMISDWVLTNRYFFIFFRNGSRGIRFDMHNDFQEKEFELDIGEDQISQWSTRTRSIGSVRLSSTGNLAIQYRSDEYRGTNKQVCSVSDEVNPDTLEIQISMRRYGTQSSFLENDAAQRTLGRGFSFFSGRVFEASTNQVIHNNNCQWLPVLSLNGSVRQQASNEIIYPRQPSEKEIHRNKLGWVARLPSGSPQKPIDIPLLANAQEYLHPAAGKNGLRLHGPFAFAQLGLKLFRIDMRNHEVPPYENDLGFLFSEDNYEQSIVFTDKKSRIDIETKFASGPAELSVKEGQRNVEIDESSLVIDAPSILEEFISETQGYSVSTSERDTDHDLSKKQVCLHDNPGRFKAFTGKEIPKDRYPFIYPVLVRAETKDGQERSLNYNVILLAPKAAFDYLK